MKKKIIICVFSVLILVTAIAFIVGAIDSYNYEVANDDILVGLGAAMVIAVGCFVVVYEIDLFYTAYYFFIKPKTITNSILNILSNLILLLIFFSDGIAHILYRYISEIFSEEVILTISLFFIYLTLRIVCTAVSVRQSTKKD